MGKDKGKSDLGQAVKIGAARGFLKAVGLDPNTFEEPKQKKKQKKKKTEVEQLKPSSNWEDCVKSKKLRRNKIKTWTTANKSQTRKRRGRGFDIQKLLWARLRSNLTDPVVSTWDLV